MWSPDGSQIALMQQCRGGLTPSLWIVNRDGSGGHELPIELPGGPQGLCFPADIEWSPNGRWFAFVTSNFAGACVSNIYLVGVDGRNVRPLTANTSQLVHYDESAATTRPLLDWSPDSRRLTFSRRVDPGRAGGTPIPYVMDLHADGSAGRTRVEVSAPIWSPSGALVAFEGPMFAGRSIRTVVYVARFACLELITARTRRLRSRKAYVRFVKGVMRLRGPCRGIKRIVYPYHDDPAAEPRLEIVWQPVR